MNTINSKQVWQGEFLNKKKNGETYWEEATIAPILNENGKLVNFIAVKEDITDKKEAKRQLLEREKELKDLNATKDKLFSIIAHDLKSPFNNILGFSELLKNNLNNYSPEKTERFIDIMYSTAKQGNNLLTNLLDWSVMQRKNHAFLPKACNLKMLISEVITLYSGESHNKRIILFSEVFDDVNVFADINMLRTVLRNLVSNAIKFTDEKGHVSVSCSEQNNKFVSKSIKS